MKDNLLHPPLDPDSLSDLANDLTRALSHDIRSPFNSTIAILTLVLEDLQGIAPADSLELLEGLLTNTRSHLAYTEAYLFHARTILGSYRPSPRACTLEDLTEALGLGDHGASRILLPPLDQGWIAESLAWFRRGLGEVSTATQWDLRLVSSVGDLGLALEAHPRVPPDLALRLPFHDHQADLPTLADIFIRAGITGLEAHGFHLDTQEKSLVWRYALPRTP